MIKTSVLGCLAAAVVCGSIRRADGPAPRIKDAESTTHADAAATYQIVDTYEYPDLRIVQFMLPVLSHYSYVMVYASAASGAQYEHEPVKEGDEIACGKAVIRVVETPGHTPDGLCGYVFSGQRPDQPVVIVTGDTP